MDKKNTAQSLKNVWFKTLLGSNGKFLERKRECGGCTQRETQRYYYIFVYWKLNEFE